MALQTVWFWIGAVGMAVGTVLAGWKVLTEERHREYYLVLAAVPGIATVAYVLMALGIGSIGADGVNLYLPRYVDWLLTTPLLVLYLGMLCKPNRRVYGALIGIDAVVILSGVAAGLAEPPLKWLLYGIGVLAYLGLLYLLLSVLPRQAALYSDRVTAIFKKLRNLTVVLWSIYPVVWLLGPLSFGLLDVSTEALVVTYLDLLTKVGFVIIAINGSDALDELADASPPDGFEFGEEESGGATPGD